MGSGALVYPAHPSQCRSSPPDGMIAVKARSPLAVERGRLGERMDQEPLTLSLRHPEMLLRPWDTNFSEAVAEELRAAFAVVGSADDHVEVLEPQFASLKRLLRRRMSPRERLLTHYLMATCAAARDITTALTENDRALNLAKAESEWGAVADLFYQRGLLFRRSGEMLAAALEYEQLLRLIGEHGAPPGTEIGQLHLDTLSRLAHFYLWLQNFERAQGYAEQAVALSKLAPTGELTLVTMLWSLALIERYRKLPYDALKHAIAAAEVYSASPSNTLSTVRILALTADLAMDMAALFLNEPEARRTFVRMAEEYAVFGERLARHVSDSSGRGLSALARARAARLRRPQGRAQALIQAVIALATREKDWALRSQAWTALGFGLRDQGDRSAARAAFEAALDDLTLMPLSMLAILPQQALHDL